MIDNIEKNFIHDFSFEFHRPARVQFDVTDNCNLDCIYCYNKSNRLLPDKEMTDQQIMEVTEKICSQLDPVLLTYSGGEPLTRKEILFKSMRCVKQYNIEIGLNTNAILINDSIANELANIGIDLLSTNIESVTPEIHDRIRGKENSYSKLIENLLLLKEKIGGNKISITVVINKQNLDSLIDIAKFVYDNGFKDLHLLDMIPHRQEEKDVFLSKNEWLRFYGIFKEMQKIPIAIKPNHALLFMKNFDKDFIFPFCMAGRLKIVISANGLIVPCDHFKSHEYVCGNAINDNLLEVWQDSALMQKFRYSLNGYEECTECKHYKKCAGGCKALAKTINGVDFSPDPYCLNYGFKDV